MRRFILAALAATLVSGLTLGADTVSPSAASALPAREAAIASHSGIDAARPVFAAATAAGAVVDRGGQLRPQGFGDFIKKVRKFLQMIRGIIDQILDHTNDGPAGGGGVKNGMDRTEALRAPIVPTAIPGLPADGV